MAKEEKKKTPLSIHFLAGGSGGFCEACACHWLDTIKVRMQLAKSTQGGKSLGLFGTGWHIFKTEGIPGLYRGIGAVMAGIVPKMAIRFASFELFKDLLADKETKKVSGTGTFLAGLGAGTTEAVAVVCPMEVVKIRMQAQYNQALQGASTTHYRNSYHALFSIVRDEGPRTLYRGVALTALRQATNQAANFTTYGFLKRQLYQLQPQYEGGELPSYQTATIGLISGAVGPFTNAPIDTLKTRIQRAKKEQGETAISRFVKVTKNTLKDEGVSALYKGITPRVTRVAPGQAVVFAVYEKVKKGLEEVSGST